MDVQIKPLEHSHDVPTGAVADGMDKDHLILFFLVSALVVAFLWRARFRNAPRTETTRQRRIRLLRLLKRRRNERMVVRVSRRYAEKETIREELFLMEADGLIEHTERQSQLTGKVIDLWRITSSGRQELKILTSTRPHAEVART
jgi:hypothetical protein